MGNLSQFSIVPGKTLSLEDTAASCMFYYCDKLTSIDASNFNTSNATTMSNMFFNVTGLTNLDVSNFNTSSATNMSRMFGSCSRLTSLNLSNFNTTKVTNMNRMFINMGGLTNLDVSSFDTSSVTDMNSIFGNCSRLTSLDVSSFDTSSVTDMNSIFYGCSGLTSLNLSNFDTSSVTDMGYMFSGCSGLTSLNLSNFDTSSVTDMGYMFYGCSGLTSLNLSNFDTSSVTNMGNMFQDCSGLTSLNLSNFDTSSVTNMGSMFSGCSGLTSLNLSNFDTSSATNMNSMFSGCSGLTSLNLSNFDTSKIYTKFYKMDGVFNGANNLIRLELGPNTMLPSNNKTNLRSGTWTRLPGGVNPTWRGTEEQLAAETTNGRAQGVYVLQTGTFTFTYNLNDATAGTTPPTANGTAGVNAIIIPLLRGITRTGYKAIGWNTAADGNGTDYTPGISIYPQAGDTTLYVKWKDATVPVIDMQGKTLFLINTPVSGIVYKKQGGPAEQGVTIKAVWSDGSASSLTTTDSDGKWSINNTGHASGTTVIITATDSAGNVSSPVTVTVTDHIAPPTVASIPLTGGHWQDFLAALIVLGIIASCITSVLLNRNRYRNR
ncbi:BspA family leucine-rich repeat surface protein [Bifidobacterium sp. ESL0745]|uniref:BspA family leucine-rich repeat surface protein n=1 Tax=Bifidobacterium sp. ESL0745 TaxID=2983226 RepID=UPI0023F92261|nr:BspA family leucine-rich repeat surface protein [Bifidobacterium sp. ESL0745]MDF7666017.1 BspA family leucine-rich repeat surface protein [Bifidobacterium sp. ESL0745]